MKKDDLRHNKDSTSPLETLVSFIEALNRLFKIGLYYPAGHIVLEQSANKCIQNVADLPPSLMSARIVVEHNRLLIDN